MKWAWKLGRYAGIDVYIHATFLLLIGWIVISHMIGGRSLGVAIAGVAFILFLFACVLLHEYGHALMARRFGIRTRDITLLPIGGVARLERMPEDPKQELWVALAGPAVNVVIAAVLFIWLALRNAWEPLGGLTLTGGSMIERLFVANVFLVLFNLIPAFPMDGGRVLRALLATRMEYTRATSIAAAVGQGTALLFGLIGLFANPFLLFIAFFVWIGAAQETAATQVKYSLAGIPVRDIMMTDFRTVSPGDSLKRAVELVLRGSQQDLPVVDNGRVAGVLTRADLLAALASHTEEAPVASVMRREFRTAEADDRIEVVLAHLQECECHTLPVLDNGALAGLITADNLGEFLLVQAALSSRPAPRVPGLPRRQAA
jgi:Zn-dependent protease/predicted transcriptional regulator